MQRIAVDSSDIVSIGYDAAEELLEIEFKGARVYQYNEVPQRLYKQFLAADSFGGFFLAHINGYYRYHKVRQQTAGPQAIAFATNNSHKFASFAAACEQFAIACEQLALDVDEIQSHDAEYIAVQKAKAAYRLVDRPVVVNDVSWYITALRGFPGGYMKDVTQWFTAADFLALMQGKQDRSISCSDTLVYYDGKRSKVFSRTHRGTIIEQPEGKGIAIDQVLVMEGQTDTVATLHGRAERSLLLEETVWYDFAKWYHLQRRMHRV